MKTKNKRLAVSVIILIAGCLLGAGVWLITDTGRNSPDLPSTAGQDTAEPLLPDNAPNPDPADALPIGRHEDEKITDFSYLKLIGVAINPDRPHAILLNEKNNTQDLYHINDRVDGATIQGIFSDRVRLKHNDQIFTLVLESLADEEKDLVPIGSDTHPGHVLSYMDQADIEKAWEETQDLMTQIEFSQIEETNEKNGVMVNRIAENSIFEEIGFRPGDILLQVDDMKISIEDDAMEIYNSLRTKETVQFTVHRAGEDLILTYPPPDSPPESAK